MRRLMAGLDPERDLSVRFHGHRAAGPFGPAAGPHSQMAQNLVLAWLGGARLFELKTVQVLDELDIPRPCIDAANVVYNIEWSQELTVPQSLTEYVKASMLVELLGRWEPLAGHLGHLIVVREDLGRPQAEFRYTPAGNDAVFFGLQGIPTINKVGPGHPECAHRVDEHVSL